MVKLALLKGDTFDRIAYILARQSGLQGHVRGNLLLITLKHEQDIRRIEDMA